MNLFDSHSHYNDEKFDTDRFELIQQAKEQGVNNLIIAGYNIESSKKALEISEKINGIYVTVGISPNDLEDIKNEKDIQDSIKQIRQMCLDKR